MMPKELGSHIRQEHGEESLRREVLAAKEQGVPDAEIGARFGISFGHLEEIITEAYGVNISVLRRPRRIKRWEPVDFREETTTVWSFKQRGDWATHDGRYRGNWSPYIPRNVILKYSEPGDVVLDYFVGGGTTAVEAKLLGRRCIARDINPGAVSITLENLRFSSPRALFEDRAQPVYEPEVSVGDARELSDIPDSSVDLICAHPPYAGIIKYSTGIPGDLSALPEEAFLTEMGKVARESLRVLKPGGKCAILIGDARKSKHVVPIGFRTIRVFLDAGFSLRELVIKRQHNCRTTGFWYDRSTKYNFLLLAHEYLPIFEKPAASRVSERRSLWQYTLPYHAEEVRAEPSKQEDLETTTVWIFPRHQLEGELRRNLVLRFGAPDRPFVEVSFGEGGTVEMSARSYDRPLLAYVSPPRNVRDAETAAGYQAALRKIGQQAGERLPPWSFLVIDTQDVRTKGVLWPLGLLGWEALSSLESLALKEIVIVTPEESPPEQPGEYLQIVHRYLLVYRIRGSEPEKG
ncbi:MAG: TRM11 family SAM-dependent methyltransferase [Anaerolineae bacterium]